MLTKRISIIVAAFVGAATISIVALKTHDSNSLNYYLPAEKPILDKEHSSATEVIERSKPLAIKSHQTRFDELVAKGSEEDLLDLLSEWGSQDPQAAADAIWKLPLGFGNIKLTIFRALMDNLYGNGNFKLASEILIKLSYLGNGGVPEYTSINQSLIDAQTTNLAKYWISEDPYAFTAWMESAPEGIDMRLLIGESFRYWAGINPELAIENALKVDDNYRSTALAVAFHGWKDRYAAESWLREFEPHPDLEPLYASMALLKAEVNPTQTVEWLELIKNNAYRKFNGGIQALSKMETLGRVPVEVSIEVANETLSSFSEISTTNLLNLLAPINAANSHSAQRAEALINGLNSLTTDQKELLYQANALPRSLTTEQRYDQQAAILRRRPGF
jgi:hypothetical protein